MVRRAHSTVDGEPAFVVTANRAYALGTIGIASVAGLITGVIASDMPPSSATGYAAFGAIFLLIVIVPIVIAIACWSRRDTIVWRARRNGFLHESRRFGRRHRYGAVHQPIILDTTETDIWRGGESPALSLLYRTATAERLDEAVVRDALLQEARIGYAPSGVFDGRFDLVVAVCPNEGDRDRAIAALPAEFASLYRSLQDLSQDKVDMPKSSV